MTGRPRSAADDVLDLLDQALAEPTPLEVPVYDKIDTCARCGAPATDERCGGCRAFLLGDTTTDPRHTALAREYQERTTERRSQPCDVAFTTDSCNACGLTSEEIADGSGCPRGRVAYVGYREAMAIGARYPDSPPPAADVVTEALFIDHSGVAYRKWWTDGTAPLRYRIPILDRQAGDPLTHEYDLAGARWRPDYLRRLIYILAGARRGCPQVTDDVLAMRVAFRVQQRPRGFGDITAS